MVVDNYAEPRPARPPIVAYRPKIKLCVIGLPDLVRALCLPAVDQIICVTISLLAVDGECPQVFRDCPNDVVDGVIPQGLRMKSVR